MLITYICCSALRQIILPYISLTIHDIITYLNIDHIGPCFTSYTILYQYRVHIIIPFTVPKPVSRHCDLWSVAVHLYYSAFCVVISWARRRRADAYSSSLFTIIGNSGIVVITTVMISIPTLHPCLVVDCSGIDPSSPAPGSWRRGCVGDSAAEFSGGFTHSQRNFTHPPVDVFFFVVTFLILACMHGKPSLE
jgi:hypothetical protein